MSSGSAKKTSVGTSSYGRPNSVADASSLIYADNRGQHHAMQVQRAANAKRNEERKRANESMKNYGKRSPSKQRKSTRRQQRKGRKTRRS